jgi:porin
MLGTHRCLHRGIGVGTILIALVILVMTAPAGAQPVAVPDTWGGSWWERPRLTGGWFGLRDELGKKGVVLDLDFLAAPQGVASGGRETKAEFWGNAEYTLNVDSQKLGLWPGAFLNVNAITGFGDTINNASGALLPPNLGTFLPNFGDEGTGLMNLAFMQFLSPKFGLIAGKLSGLGGDNNAFAHDFRSQFMNTALNLNPALAVFPFSAYGGGLLFLPWEGALFTAAVLDPSGTPMNNDITEAFKDGVMVNAEGRVEIKPFGLVGHQLVGFAWSNKTRVSLEQDPTNIATALLRREFTRLNDPGPGLRRILERFFPSLLVPVVPLNRSSDAWTVYYNFDQYLWSPAGHADRGVGVFFRFGASDGDVNPVRWAYNVGVSGNGIVAARPHDTFGIGWARTELSNNFVPFLRQRLHLGLDKEDAIEMYYNASITRWLNATLDLQIVDQALDKKLDSSGRLTDMGTTVIAGFRLYARF